MRVNIITEYPMWLSVLCVLMGLLYSYVLYNKNNLFSTFVRWLLFGFRFIIVTLLSFFLLSPLIKKSINYSEKPIIVFIQDNSTSIILNSDSIFYNTIYKDNIKEKLNQLSTKYEVKYYLFGENVEESDFRNDFKFNNKQTNFTQLSEYLQSIYSNRNVGALIMASDGIYNRGSNPVHAFEKVQFPVNVIALGDTSSKSDLVIEKVNYNKISFLQNQFPVEIIIHAEKYNGKECELQLLYNDSVIRKKKIYINSDNFYNTQRFYCEAKAKGIQRYLVRVLPFSDEATLINNKRNIFIDVINNKQKILILSKFPHPDISSLKQAIETNVNYEVKVHIENEPLESVSEYSLVIMYQLPSNGMEKKKYLDEIYNKEIPLLYIIGSATNISNFNKLKTGVKITGNNKSYNEITPNINRQFSLFTLDDDIIDFVDDFPPLHAPFGKYSSTASLECLSFQKIGKVNTNNPMIAFAKNNGVKTGFIFGEGLWKWPLYSYKEKSTTKYYSIIINKIVQYLSVKEDKRLFRVTCKNEFEENESVEFKAELFNESYELINDREVSISISNSKGDDFRFELLPDNDVYYIDAGQFPIGLYKYKSKVKMPNGKELFSSGEFFVSQMNYEAIDLKAKHGVLYQLAMHKNGEMHSVYEMDKLFENLYDKRDIKPIAYQKIKFLEIIDIKVFFIFIMILLSVEWFIRKYFGGY